MHDERRLERRGVRGCCSIPLETATMDRLEEIRERARRILIYRHMSNTSVVHLHGRPIVTGGRVRFDLLAVWPYQPSEAEVDEELAVLASKHAKHLSYYHRAKHRQSA